MIMYKGIFLRFLSFLEKNIGYLRVFYEANFENVRRLWKRIVFRF